MWSIKEAWHASLLAAGGSITSTASSAISSSVRRLRMFPDPRHDRAGRRHGLGAEVGPGGHQPTALLELVAALVCLLGLVADLVRERELAGLVREIGALARPGFEGAPHTM